MNPLLEQAGLFDDLDDIAIGKLNEPIDLRKDSFPTNHKMKWSTSVEQGILPEI